MKPEERAAARARINAHRLVAPSTRLIDDLAAALDAIDAANERLAELKASIGQESHDVEQALGRALGYPRYSDDPKNFPPIAGADHTDDVCVGEHVPASLAAKAAKRIAKLEAALREIAETRLEAPSHDNLFFYRRCSDGGRVLVRSPRLVAEDALRGGAS